MPLKKKIAILLTFCLAINLIFTTLYFKYTFSKNLNFTVDHINKNFENVIEELGPDVTISDLNKAIVEKFQDEHFINNFLFQVFKNGIKFSIGLLALLLVSVLLFIDKEVCAPLNRLSKVIENFNSKNGYYLTRHAKNEIKNLTINFNMMSEQIELNKKRQNEFIGCISHDLKTPLTSILGYTQRLLNPGIKEEQKRIKYYETILSKAGDIQNLVEELNAYITEEIQDLNVKKVNLKAFFDDIVAEYAEELQTYNVNLIPSIHLSENLYSSFDDSQIRRVFANIFSNTVSHGGKNITLSLLTYRSHNTLITKLENNGPELPNEAYDKVFELMYQADTSRTSHSHNGRGLGLTIVKQIIERHNGTIKAYKPPSGGFGIEFTLPII